MSRHRYGHCQRWVVAMTLAATICLAWIGAGPGLAAGDSGDGSPDGYPDATPAEAEDLFSTDFSATVDSLANDPPDLSGENPTYLDDHTAVISPAVTGSSDLTSQVNEILANDQGDIEAATADLNALVERARGSDTNPPLLVSSVLPLRAADDTGSSAPVDLALSQEGGGYAPQNPLVDLTLPGDLNSDATVGDGIGVDLGATAPATADPINGGDDLFYADAAPATDVVLAPISTGLEALYELRAPESPDHLQMTLSLPAGASLEATDDGGAEVVQGGDTLATIPPPAAQDASGAPVPVTTSVDGNALELDILHADPAISYPISIDPTIDAYNWTGGGLSYPGWQTTQSTGSAYQVSAMCTPCGLWTKAQPAYSYPSQSGGWVYKVPHYPSTSAYINNLTLGPINYAMGSDAAVNPYLRTGIYSPTSSSWPVLVDQKQNVSNLNLSLSPGTSTTGSEAFFRLTAPASATNTLGDWRTANLGGATVSLSDTDPPQLTAVNQTGLNLQKQSSGWWMSDWVDAASVALTATATDGGLGIQSFQFPASTAGLQTKSEGCSGGDTSPCAQSATESASFDTGQWPSGSTLTNVAATDATGQLAWQGWEVRVDHSPPAIAMSGSLNQANAGAGPYSLHVDAADGNAFNLTGRAWQSGVKSIEVDVNGNDVADAGPQGCPGESASCPLSLDYSLDPLDFPSNQLHFKVVATDELGHIQTQEWDTTIQGADTAPPQLSTSGRLVAHYQPSGRRRLPGICRCHRFRWRRHLDQTARRWTTDR